MHFKVFLCIFFMLYSCFMHIHILSHGFLPRFPVVFLPRISRQLVKTNSIPCGWISVQTVENSKVIHRFCVAGRAVFKFENDSQFHFCLICAGKTGENFFKKKLKRLLTTT